MNSRQIAMSLPSGVRRVAERLLSVSALRGCRPTWHRLSRRRPAISGRWHGVDDGVG